MKSNTLRLFWISLGIGWVFDLLFWGKGVGISFPLFVIAAVGAGLWAARVEGVQAHRNSLWLLVPIGWFAVMSAVRMEPMTAFMDRSLTMILMVLLAVSFEGGRWPYYQLRDHFMRTASFTAAALTRWTKVLANQYGVEDGGRARWIKVTLRVLLAALPVFFIFGGLLSSADAVFADYFEAVLTALRIENLVEYVQRGIIILLVATVLFGVYWQALFASQEDNLPGERIKTTRFLGFAEAAAALVTAILLFAVFVGIQFRYFFFGQENITINGYTYAEYARRGFFELIVVAFFSLLLLIMLSTFAKRESEKHQQVFSWLGMMLVALVLIILVSAFERLTLYEQAYGFTRLRTYSHVFMIWLGMLLAAAGVFEALGRSTRFALALLLAVLGFAASLNFLNVDAFITRANIRHAFQYEPEGEGGRSPNQVLDLSYLTSLSPDAVPAFQQLFEEAHAAGDTLRREMAAGALACHANRWDDYSAEYPWQSFHFSPWQARNIWVEGRHETDFDSGVQFDNEAGAYVIVGGEKISCQG